jgi:hypothetical protein
MKMILMDIKKEDSDQRGTEGKREKKEGHKGGGGRVE